MLTKLKRLLKFFMWIAGAVLFFIVVSNVFIRVRSAPYIYESTDKVPKAQVALIPGAAVLVNGDISPIFRDRVDTAIALYVTGKVSKILVSGDNSTLSHNEVNPVRVYLIQKGIPDTDIYLDHAGFDTYSTMYRARDIFEVSSVIISTQSFHLPRAVFIARMLGIEAYGVSADRGSIRFKNYIREVFADEKAMLDVVFHTKPKFLGDPIPIR